MNLQQKNRQIGTEFENRVLDEIEDKCVFAGIMNETSGGHSTPDIACITPDNKTVMIEAKNDGYVKPKQRDELTKLAETTHENTVLQVAYPRGQGIVRDTISDENMTVEETREALEHKYGTMEIR